MPRKSKKATETATETSAPKGPLSSGLCFSVKRKDLAAHLRRLATIATKPRQSSLPILGHVALRSNQFGVVLATTDLDTWCVIDAPSWTVEGTGGMTVPVKALSDIVRKLPDGVVTVRASEHGIRVSCGGVEAALIGHPDRDFPKVPVMDSAKPLASVDAATIREMIGAVDHAICQDETRFHLNGIWFQYDGTTARMVATDGHRLAKVERALSRAGDFKSDKGMILRAKGCAAIRSLLAKDNGLCDIGENGPIFMVRTCADGVVTTIGVKVIDAQFPPYEQVIPKDNRRLVTIDRAALSGAVDRAADMCTSTRGLVLEMADGQLAIVAEHPDKGTAREALAAEFVGTLCDGFSIGVNPAYLIEALAGISHERVTLAFSHNDKVLKNRGETHNGKKLLDSQLSPILVRSCDDAGMYAPLAAPYLSVVMPMRV